MTFEHNVLHIYTWRKRERKKETEVPAIFFSNSAMRPFLLLLPSSRYWAIAVFHCDSFGSSGLSFDEYFMDFLYIFSCSRYVLIFFFFFFHISFRYALKYAIYVNMFTLYTFVNLYPTSPLFLSLFFFFFLSLSSSSSR